VSALLLVAGLLAAPALAAAPAQAAEPTHPHLGAFCEPTGLGTAPCEPSFGEPAGLAVDQSDGDLYVIDYEDQTLSRYHEDGTPDDFSALSGNVIDGASGEDETESGEILSSEGNGAQEVQVAVAPPGAGGGTAGDIYVTNAENGEVDIFASSGKYLGDLGATYPCGVAVAPDGDVYVGDYEGGEEETGAVHKFVPSAPDTFTNPANFESTEVCNVAAGAGPTAGFVFATQYESQVTKIAGEGAEEGETQYTVGNPSGSNVTVAVDPVSGRVYTTPRQSGELLEFDASGASAAKQVSATSAGSAVHGIAVDEASGDVYLDREGEANVEVFGPLSYESPPPTATTEAATEITLTSAVLDGQVDPKGGNTSDCHFEWGPSEGDYSSGSAPCSPDSGTATEAVEVSAEATGLTPHANYHYRVVITTDGGTAEGADRTFLASPRPTATTGTASEIRVNGARLNATVNPEGGSGGRCYFQWGPAAGNYTTGSAPCQPDPGSATTDKPVYAEATGLSSLTTYHFRVLEKTDGGTAEGADAVFITSGPPTITGTGVESVEDTSAQLVANVNPNGQPTTYHFEYISDAAWQKDGEAYGAGRRSAPVAVPAAVGAGSEALFVAQEVTGLEAATTYHFRLVATNASSPTGGTVGPDVTFTTRLQPLPADHRAYELVTPAEKPGGQGVGSYSNGGDADNFPGVASVGGGRYVSQVYAGSLTPGSFLYNHDFAFSERVGGAVGWTSHSPFTQHEYGTGGGANTEVELKSADADLSVFAWAAELSGNQPHLFPEMASWPRETPHVGYASDWQGRWELLAPTAPTIENGGLEQFESADGSHLPFQTEAPGQLGPEDPSLGQVAGSRALYDDAVPGATPFLPSDRFQPDGVRSLVGVCTGEGPGRTEIPVVEASGDLSVQACPPAAPGRSAALLSPGGAAIGKTPNDSYQSTTQSAVSEHGSRIFFMSPDPAVAKPACEGEGATTSCPAQLYVRQLNAAGEPTVRWLSRSAVPGQEASLTGPALFEGASVTGSRVFFRTDSPLTADDPNGTGSAPVTGGSASPQSWDLYEYEVPSNPAGEPDGEDPGDGRMTRISAGPTGHGDCNVSGAAGTSAGLRFASDDGTRLYFVCAAPLEGVETNSHPTDGTITTAGGSPTNGEFRNLYYYDADKPLAERWEFVARLPTGGGYGPCATSAAQPGQPFVITDAGTQYSPESRNCFKGSTDGRFVTFMTPGRLVASDPDATSVDIYAFDAESDRLIRIDTPQGGAGGTYGCGGSGAPVSAPTEQCFADDGFNGYSFGPLAGVATEPDEPGEHVVFFESKSRLVPGDVNDQYDVYEWRNGRLSLVSTGTGEKGAYYAGNGATGRDVFLETPERLTWQDVDGVMDIYDARVGGGVPEPQPGTPCGALAGQCQPPPAAPPAAAPPASVGPAGPTNQATPKPRRNPYAKASKKKKAAKCRKGKAQRHGRCVKGHKKKGGRHKKTGGHQKRRHAGTDRRAGR
jgi:hypothetical protein